VLSSDWPLDVIRALRFRDASDEGLRRLAQRDWKRLVAQTDRAHLTLPLAVRCRSSFPAGAQRYLDGALERNARRYDSLLAAYVEIADQFRRSSVDFLVLKGFAQWPWYVDDPRHRYQSDLDFCCPPESLGPASKALAGLSYEPHGDGSPTAVDHLPIMIRKTGWTWQGDYYDPARPPFVEVHFRFWDKVTEGFPAVDTELFWQRRKLRDLYGTHVPALHPVDGLSYSAMHLVRHLLRGELQIRHVYELAHFLERSADDDTFWNEWRTAGSDRPRVIEAVSFRLAAEWFGCRLHPAALRTLGQLPTDAARWFQLFCFSPAVNVSRPNKDELWLHLCLVQDPDVRRRIAVRRLLPGRRQRVILDAQLPGGAGGALLKLRRVLYEGCFLSGRALHHLRTLMPLVRSGVRWWRAGAALP
jgi:hypothetical protein